MAANNSSNSSLFPVNLSCLFHKPVYDQFCLVPAFMIITIIAFLNKRVKIKPNVCDGRPGLVLPINFLGDNTSNRLSIAVSFGVIAGNFFQLFREMTHFGTPTLSGAIVELHVRDSWEKAFRSVSWVLLYGMINFPIFACLMTEHLLVGAVFGLLYTLMKFITIMALVISCPSPYLQIIQKIGLNPVFKNSELFECLPELLCYLFLLVRFSVLLTKELYRKYWKPYVAPIEEPISAIAKRHNYIHVRLLLSNKLTERLSASWNWCIKIRNWIYKPRPDFKFSTEMASTMIVSVIFIYQMTVHLVIVGALYTNILQRLQKEQEKTKTNSVYYLIYELLDILVGIFEVSVNVSAFFSAIFSVFMMLHFIKCHREHVLLSYKTTKYFGNSPSRLVGRSLSYPGYQVAYIGLGYIMLTSISSILSICIGFITEFHLWDTFFHYAIKKWLPFIVVFACIWIFQYLLGWLVFRDRRFPDHTINVNNHRFYCVMSFFFFFLNILVGLLSSGFRLLKSLLLGIVFMSRIDRTPLMMSYHKWDQGYMSYIGFLNVLKSFSHPVMLVFCQLLVDQRQTRRNLHALENETFIGDTMTQQVIDSEEQERPPSRTVSKAACNRWLVAYTLLKNPHLQQFRKQSLRNSFLTEIEASSNVSSSPLVIN